MALTDNNNGNGLIMPVAPMGYGYGGNYGGGFGGFGCDGWWVILFLFALMGNNWGFGGFGGGNEAVLPYLYNNTTQNDVNRGFDNSAVIGQLNGIQSSISNGFGSAEVANCNRAMDAMQTAYTNQIADMNRSFDAQTAVTGQLNGISSALAKCCCDNELATESLRFTVATENAADREALSNGIRDVITNATANTQAILDKLCQQELDAERRENAELRSRINMLDLAQSQNAQTAALVADNTAQTQALIQRIAPYPIPSYPVANPYGYNNGFGYGCGCGCGCGVA